MKTLMTAKPRPLKRIKQLANKYEILGDGITIDLKARYTTDELLTLMRTGIEYFYNKKDYGKNFRALCKTYAMVCLSENKKPEKVEYGDVMFIEEKKELP